MRKKKASEEEVVQVADGEAAEKQKTNRGMACGIRRITPPTSCVS